MKRRLVVMRHAKSAWDTDAPDDHSRPLNKRGRRDAPRVAAALSSLGWAPDRAISSTSERTRETWQRMAFRAVPVAFDARLYHAGIGAVQEVVAEVADDCGTLLLLGHNPGFSSVVGWLSGEPTGLTTANAALLSTDAATWRGALQQSWTLHQVIRPRELA